jgi:ABC-type uncharacterized transport system auxiliary subunit
MKTTHLASILLVLAIGCGGSAPPTRFYHLAPAPPGRGAGTEVLVLEPLTTDAGYDDERMVYRTSPYRFDYYDYHRWSAAPGVLVGDYLEQALERSGRFKAVLREASPSAALVMSGRVVAIEEVDRAKGSWFGHIVLELQLTDQATNEVVWTEQFDETEPMPVQTPEGLARALSTAMQRVVRRAAPVVGELAARHSAARVAHADVRP